MPVKHVALPPPRASEQAEGAEAAVAGAADDDMVVDGDAQPGRGLGDVAGDRDVLAARFGIAAGVIVDEDECGGAEFERSEEHTSELQSLMRISYAVFCLKKTT